MTILKTITVVLCLIGIAANPVVAKFLPCCCTDERATKHACCHVESKSAEKASASNRTCCTKKAVARSTSLRSDCCCVEDLPVSAPVQVTPAKTDIEKPFVKAILPPAYAHAPFDDGVIYLRDHFSGRFRASGPSLLKLHCLWLK